MAQMQPNGPVWYKQEVIHLSLVPGGYFRLWLHKYLFCMFIGHCILYPLLPLVVSSITSLQS